MTVPKGHIVLGVIRRKGPITTLPAHKRSALYVVVALLAVTVTQTLKMLREITLWSV